MASEMVKRRLHVSGLTPQITSAHLKDRFSSFGQISEVEDLGLNAVGQHRPFTFLTIETTASQLQKCLNIMSGSTWRGARLLIAPARSSYISRLAAERNPPPDEVHKKMEKQRKRKRSEMGPDVGRPAQDMRLVSHSTMKSRKHWKMAPDGRLVRPLAMRPSHPLAPPSVSAAAAAVPLGGKRKVAVKRARRRVIDPTTWESSYLLEDAWPGASAVDEKVDEWIFEDIQDVEEEVDGEGKTAIGVWRKVDGKEEEVVRLRLPQSAQIEEGELEEAREEEGEDEWEGISAADTSSDLFGHQNDDRRSASPLFPASHTSLGANEDEDAATEESIASEPVSRSSTGERSASPLFASRRPSLTIANQSEREDEPDESSQSASPLPSSPKARAREGSPQRGVLPPSAPAPRPKLPEDIRTLAREERAHHVSLLSSFLRTLPSSPSPSAASPATGAETGRRKNEWAGYAESESDGGEEGADVPGIPLRLRGGAGPPGGDSSSSDEDEDEDDSDDSDEDDDDSSDTTSDHSDDEDSDESNDDPTASSATNTAPPVSGKPKGGLKDLFTPTATSATAGFSLADLGDIDIDDSVPVPLSHSLPAESSFDAGAGLEPLGTINTSKKALFEVDQGMPLFFPISLLSSTATGLPSGGAGAGRTNDPALGYGAGAPPVDGAAGEDGSLVVEEGWWAQETDAQMREIWMADKYGLTKGWKRRAREGRKQKRRRGGDDDD